MISTNVYFLVAAVLSCIGIGLSIHGITNWILENKDLIAHLKSLPKIRNNQSASLIRQDNRLEALDRLFLPADEKSTTTVKRKLLRAGYRNPSATRFYYAIKWGIAIAGSIILDISFYIIRPFDSIYLTFGAIIMGSLICVFATDEWIARRTHRRKLAIQYGFPDALDLLLVCIEAGQGMDQAIARVARELRRIHPVLAEELFILVGELSAGKVRAEALSDFADRANVASVASFVTVLKQSAAYGVSISESLRVYSHEVRDKRFMKAEERANMMPVKLALSTTLLTLYPLLAILVGPAFISIIAQIQKAG